MLGVLPGAGQPLGLAFDGFDIWAANNGSNAVTQIPRPRRRHIEYFQRAASGLTNVTFDGASVWVANTSSNSASKL